MTRKGLIHRKNNFQPTNPPTSSYIHLFGEHLIHGVVVVVVALLLLLLLLLSFFLFCRFSSFSMNLFHPGFIFLFFFSRFTPIPELRRESKLITDSVISITWRSIKQNEPFTHPPGEGCPCLSPTVFFLSREQWKRYFLTIFVPGGLHILDSCLALDIIHSLSTSALISLAHYIWVDMLIVINCGPSKVIFRLLTLGAKILLQGGTIKLSS